MASNPPRGAPSSAVSLYGRPRVVGDRFAHLDARLAAKSRLDRVLPHPLRPRLFAGPSARPVAVN